MPRIEQRHAYDGVEQKIDRLGLRAVVDELEEILTQFDLRLLEQKDANGGAAVRRIIDERFALFAGWEKKQSGGVDWTKCHHANGTLVCVGVEIQVSARSDLIAVDIIHLREQLAKGAIDVAIIVVPSDSTAPYLTDRGPSMSDARRHIEAARATDEPFYLIGVSHGGPGQALPKQARR